MGKNGECVEKSVQYKITWYVQKGTGERRIGEINDPVQSETNGNGGNLILLVAHPQTSGVVWGKAKIQVNQTQVTTGASPSLP